MPFFVIVSNIRSKEKKQLQQTLTIMKNCLTKCWSHNNNKNNAQFEHTIFLSSSTITIATTNVFLNPHIETHNYALDCKV